MRKAKSEAPENALRDGVLLCSNLLELALHTVTEPAENVG